jgi:hypothetical protein
MNETVLTVSPAVETASRILAFLVVLYFLVFAWAIIRKLKSKLHKKSEKV